MRTVGVRELKARLSAYLSQVGRGEEFLVTDRGRVVARLSRPDLADPKRGESTQLAKLAALGVRLPLRQKGPVDYRRPGARSGLTTKQIDDLLEDIRGEE